MMALTEDGSREFGDGELTTAQRRLLRIGRRSKERMMKANLRLVVSVAKKYQGKGLASRSHSGGFPRPRARC